MHVCSDNPNNGNGIADPKNVEITLERVRKNTVRHLRESNWNTIDTENKSWKSR